MTCVKWTHGKTGHGPMTSASLSHKIPGETSMVTSPSSRIHLCCFFFWVMVASVTFLHQKHVSVIYAGSRRVSDIYLHNGNCPSRIISRGSNKPMTDDACPSGSILCPRHVDSFHFFLSLFSSSLRVHVNECACVQERVSEWGRVLRLSQYL